MMTSTRNWRELARAVVVAALMVGSGAQAQPGEEKALEQILVLGVRDDNFNVAVTDEFIDERQIFDLEGMFRHEPSITVGGGLPVAQKVYVRGLEDTQLNVTIDGATQAGYLYHHQGRINLEPELIKDVVIEAGAGRATTGPGALGGAMHFRTIDALDKLDAGEYFGAILKGAYHNVNEGDKYHASLFGRFSDDFGWLASYTQYETDNYEDGNGNEVLQSAVDQESVLLKVSGDVAPGHYLSLSYEDRSDNGIRFARPNMVGLFHPVYPSIPVPQTTEREAWVGNYRYQPGGNWADLNATLYYNDNVLTKQGDMFLDHWPPSPPFVFMDYYNGREHGGGIESTGLNLSNVGRWGDNEVTYGLEWRTDTTYLINGIAPGFSDEDADVIGLFAQADLQLSDVITLSIGARYDDYEYTDNQGVNFSDSAVSPNVSLQFAVTSNLSFQVGYAQAFKGVQSPEIWFLEFPPTGTTLSNYIGPNFTQGGFTLGTVEAEQADNIEVGFRFESENFSASGEIFQQTIDNAQVTGTTQRHSYKDEVDADGYALRIGYWLNGLSINAGVSETDPTLNGEPLSSGDMGLGTAYGRTWNTGIEYSFEAINLNIGWNARLVEDLDFVRAGQDEKDGYNIHDIFASWTIADWVELGLAVSNVTDEFYYDQGTFFTQAAGGSVIGLPQPGRNIKFTASFDL